MKVDAYYLRVVRAAKALGLRTANTHAAGEDARIVVTGIDPRTGRVLGERDMLALAYSDRDYGDECDGACCAHSLRA